MTCSYETPAEEKKGTHPIDKAVMKSVGYLLLLIIIFAAVRTNINVNQVVEQKDKATGFFANLASKVAFDDSYIELIERNVHEFDGRITYDIYLEAKFKEHENTVAKIHEWMEKRDENTADVWIINVTDVDNDIKMKFLRLNLRSNPDRRVPKDFEATEFTDFYVQM